MVREPRSGYRAGALWCDKLIIAQKRTAENVKRQKDLMQAKSLMEALAESDPWAWKDAINDASAQGKAGWAEPIKRSLKELRRRKMDRYYQFRETGNNAREELPPTSVFMGPGPRCARPG